MDTLKLSPGRWSGDGPVACNLTQHPVTGRWVGHWDDGVKTVHYESGELAGCYLRIRGKLTQSASDYHLKKFSGGAPL